MPGDSQKNEANINGSNNTVEQRNEMTKGAAPQREISREEALTSLAAIAKALEQVKGANELKVKNRMGEAMEDARRESPNRDEVGAALKQALTYAKDVGLLAEIGHALKPHVETVASWLGANWATLVRFVS